MIQIAFLSLLCLIVAVVCLVVAGIIGFMARLAASQGGAVGCFMLASVFLCGVGGLLILAGFC